MTPKPLKNHRVQWSVIKKVVNGDGQRGAKPSKNHWCQWFSREKTIVSHRSQKMTIVHLYMVATFSLLYKKPFYRRAKRYQSSSGVLSILRNQIMARRMQALGSNRTAKEEIIFNLATSGGISGVNLLLFWHGSFLPMLMVGIDQFRHWGAIPKVEHLDEVVNKKNETNDAFYHHLALMQVVVSLLFGKPRQISPFFLADIYS